MTTINHNTPARWKQAHPPPGCSEYILISQMDDAYLLNAIRYCINKKGHKHTKFDKLVLEAQKRGLPLPKHKWVKESKENVKDNAKYVDDMAKTIMGVPEVDWQEECPICRGTVISIGHGRKACLNCDKKSKDDRY